jgi:hypothetical protein
MHNFESKIIQVAGKEVTLRKKKMKLIAVVLGLQDTSDFSTFLLIFYS